MSDEIDQAVEREELHRAIALNTRRPSGPSFVGECHNCGQELAYPKRFCDADCRDDYERAAR